MEQGPQSQRGLARTGKKTLSDQQEFSETAKIVFAGGGGFLPIRGNGRERAGCFPAGDKHPRKGAVC